jgi:ubiquinone/menaquinone biosynthesis C-methylase UbiE
MSDQNQQRAGHQEAGEMSQPAASTAYVGKSATEYDRRRFTCRTGKVMHIAEWACLADALRRVPKDASILEVGCGTGRLLLDAREHGYRVSGLDASPDMLNELRQKGDDRYPDLELHLSEAASMPFDNDSFDLVYAIRVLSPTKSRDYALRVVDEMMRITRPGGFMLVEFQNTYRPRIGVARKPSVRFTPREIAERGRAAGGEVVAYRGAFFLSMQAYWLMPKAVVGVFGWVDRVLSRLMPRLCARAYVLFRKGHK